MPLSPENTAALLDGVKSQLPLFYRIGAFMLVVLAGQWSFNKLISLIFDTPAAREKKEYADYEKYSENRERAEKFSNTYSAEHDFNGPPEPKNRKQTDGVYFS